MTLRDYLKGLTEKQLAVYARRAGTTAGYIRVHLLATPPRKIPRRALMEGLASASGGVVSYDDVVNHFYGQQAVAS